METISEKYLAQQKKLHENPNYGVASIAFAPIVAEVIGKSGLRIVCDYGAGKKNLLRLDEIGVDKLIYRPYDPAYPEYGPPIPSELVCCIDVMEHVEPEYIENVLQELQTITEKLLFLTIHMGPAAKVLDDGRNAHLTQKGTAWWLSRIVNYFEVEQLQKHKIMGRGFWTILRPLDQESR